MNIHLSVVISAVIALLLATPINGRLPPTGIPVGEFAHGDFPPLECNNQLNVTTCTSFAEKEFDLWNIVIIPCGECYIFDLPDEVASNVTFDAGLEIVGKLVFPKNKKAKIYSPFIHVQGVLEITNDEIVTNETSLEFIMTGTRDEPFYPHKDNAASCLNQFCNTGKKTIAVAGGQLDIRAFPDNCTTWVKLLDVVKDAETVQVPEIYPKAPIPPAGCGKVAFSNDFESGRGPFKSSLGSIDTLESGSHDGSNYLRVADRTRSWQGPFIGFTHFLRDCMVPNEKYLIRAKYRLVPTNSTPSNCQEYGQDCLTLMLHHMTNETKGSWRLLASTPPAARSQDNEWTNFYAVIEFFETDIQPDGIYQMLYWSGPEPGIMIDMDDIHMTLPDESMFPDPNSVICDNLITNGDASLSDQFAFPFLLVGNSGSYLSIKQEDNNGTLNNYFSIVGRDAGWTTITQDMINDCIVLNSIYNFRMKIRVHSDEDTDVRFTIKTFSPLAVDPDYIVESIGYCPPASKETGWVQCSRNFLFSTIHETATKIELSFIVENNETADIDYDDISISLHAPPVKKLVVPGESTKCWGVGAKILQTSHTLSHKDYNVLTIENITTNSDGNTVLLVDKGIAKPTTVADDPRVAVEVALLSRNVKITGADDDPVNPLHGANLMILHTPNVAQRIEGVLFKDMGQMGNLGKYPIHLHINTNVEGTVISKNTILDSNQRCIVIHDTHNVTLEYNIGFNGFGHCFFLEDGIEQDNHFNYNLGAGQKITPDSGILSIAESDMFPATFWISNPKNFFLGNVAAGSEDNGFWYEMLEILRGRSQKKDPTYSINPSSFDFGYFKDCVTHSNAGDGFKLYPNGYFPKERAWFENLYSYRNVGDGNLLHNSANLGVLGGYYADNRIQIEVDKQADDVVVKDCLVEGYTPLYQFEVEAGNRKSHCPAWRPLTGIQLHSFLRYRDSKGYHIKNVTFNYFGKDVGCVGSCAIEMDAEIRDGHFDAYAVLEDIHFPENTPLYEKFTTCDLHNNPKFQRDLVIMDKTGDFNPTPGGGPGWIVSNDTKMTSFSDKCVNMEGTCALFCEGLDLCFRAINFAVPPSWHYDDMILEVTDDTGKIQNFYGYFENITTIVRNEEVEDTYENYVYQRRRYYTAILPGSRNYTIEFKKNDQPYWPQFVEMVWEDPPDCGGYPTDDNINFQVPPPTQNECDQVIRNSGGEDGYFNFWTHTGGGITEVQGTAGDDVHTGNWAVSSSGRSLAHHGPGQFLDTRCMTLGQQYEIMVRVRLREGSTGLYVKCNVNREAFEAADVCPRVALRMRTFQGNTIADEVDLVYAYPMAVALGPWRKESWNKLFGVFNVNENIAGATSVLMMIERARPGLEIVIDDVTITKTTKTCDMPIYNVGLESGDTRYWSSFGTTEIDMYTPGYNSAYALRTIERNEFWGSMAQAVNRECMTLGIDYEVSAMFKLLQAADDSEFDCNPYLSWGAGTNVCPTMSLRIRSGTAVKDIDIGSTSATYVNGNWNAIYGTFNATEEIMNADVVSLFFRKFHHGLHIVIDDVKMIGSVTEDPNQVINNGDLASGDSRYFSLYNGGFIDVISPGYDGDGDWALKVTGRQSEKYGVSQSIDTSVLKSERLYKFRAQVKLFKDDLLSVPFACEPKSNDPFKRCPLMSLRAHSVGSAPFYRIVAAAPKSWSTEDWNFYEATVELMPFEVAAESLRLIIDRAAVNVNMVLDNIEFRVISPDTEAPTTGPSESPTLSMSPTISKTSNPSLSPSAEASNYPSQGFTSKPSISVGSTGSTGPTKSYHPTLTSQGEI